MRLSPAPLLAAAALSLPSPRCRATAFQIRPGGRARHPARPSSSVPPGMVPESIADAAPTSVLAPPVAAGAGSAAGEVLSIASSASSSFAAVKMREEDAPSLPSSLTAAGVGVTGGTVPLAGDDDDEDEGDRVELASALFAATASAPQKKNGDGT